MKYIKQTLLTGLAGLFVSISPLSGQANPDDKGIDMENIGTLVTEAQQMAKDWANRLREWKESGGKRTTYMGIVMESVPDVLRDYIDLPKGVGLLLTHIAPDSPAEKAGLVDNDILVSFAGQLVINYSQISTLIDLQGPGAEVPVTVLRKGEEMEFTVILEERTRRGNQFMPVPAPDAPPAPTPPDAPAVDDVGVFMERIEEWLPGSVSIFVDQNEQVHVDLQDLRENLQDLRVKLESLQSPGAQGSDEALVDITREYGDFGARTSIVRMADSQVNYSSNKGKLVLSPTEKGQRVMVWNRSGDLLYEGDLPGDFESALPAEAVELIKAYQQTKAKLELETTEESLEIRLNDEAIDPVTWLGN